MGLLLRNATPPTLRERIMDRIPLEQIKERIPFQMKPEPPSRIRRAAPLVAAGAAGAALAFVFDPERGRGRRAKAKDMIAGRARRTARATGRRSRYMAGKVSGLRHRMAGRVGARDGEVLLDDVTLADKIRSEALGGRWDAKQVIVNVEDGVVALRGEVDTPADTARIERIVRDMPGVLGVENLLHLKGSDPVNKMPARKASR